MAKFRFTVAANRARAEQVYEKLAEAYPQACCSLNSRSPLELLVATILAAQCTDARVNVVMKDLTKRYRTAEDFAGASQRELEEAVRTCGFYRNKAKSIRRACAALVGRFGGKVPGTMEELLTLEGVGRKTANVVLGECFGTPGIIVDTHCGRLARRLGFTKETEPARVEKDLMRIWAKPHWTSFSHCMVFHGRAICHARKPKCEECPVQELCPFPGKGPGRRGG